MDKRLKTILKKSTRLCTQGTRETMHACEKKKAQGFFIYFFPLLKKQK